jgi:hypothetical protein
VFLLWGAALEPDEAIPFRAGGYFRTFWDAASPDAFYCIDEGEIGLVTTRPEDKYLKFAITKAHAGEVGMTAYTAPGKCDGAEVAVDLRGCVYRYAN